MKDCNRDGVREAWMALAGLIGKLDAHIWMDANLKDGGDLTLPEVSEALEKISAMLEVALHGEFASEAAKKAVA